MLFKNTFPPVHQSTNGIFNFKEIVFPSDFQPLNSFTVTSQHELRKHTCLLASLQHRIGRQHRQEGNEHLHQVGGTGRCGEDCSRSATRSCCGSGGTSLGMGSRWQRTTRPKCWKVCKSSKVVRNVRGCVRSCMRTIFHHPYIGNKDDGGSRRQSTWPT